MKLVARSLLGRANAGQARLRGSQEMPGTAFTGGFFVMQVAMAIKYAEDFARAFSVSQETMFGVACRNVVLACCYSLAALLLAASASTASFRALLALPSIGPR